MEYLGVLKNKEHGKMFILLSEKKQITKKCISHFWGKTHTQV